MISQKIIAANPDRFKKPPPKPIKLVQWWSEDGHVYEGYDTAENYYKTSHVKTYRKLSDEDFRIETLTGHVYILSMVPHHRDNRVWTR